ncbi:23S rRNA pseudouridine2605 synthase [Luteimonas cucumeris]|uniref:Pseudouridine synthase n=1 Tax=Luteimonas cucumeris TaxID=985012 RepID=A0A562L7X3_9GAMM|nr:pseudouridine synthase [Luteimonas cucumeris]TWI03685.1 23S rRNA pseudouridine2605 synthase [Luteimonas cucumeris]
MSEKDTPSNKNTGSRKLSLKRGAEQNNDSSPRLEERLHKVLAQAGLGSRRALEQRIADGLVKVNGEVAQTGMSIGSGDKVELDGRSFVASALTEPARVLLYNKPEGEVTTREDPEGRPTIFEALPALKGARWIAIGRLDINTTGLLLLTTDGELANAMMHPSFEVEREYVCRVRAPEGMETVPDNIVDRLRRGVALDDGPAKFDDIERIGGTDSHDWFRVLLKEGRNREVRRLWESQGCQVSRLKRIRYGSVALPQPLLRGQSQEMAADKVEMLRKELKLEEGPPPALTLQPVIGQRKAAKSTVHLSGERAHGYVGGHNTADEGRELRRFDHVREDRGRGRFGARKPHGGLTVSGEAAAKQAHKPFKQRAHKGPKPLPEGNPAAFRTWYVPEGVDTGPTGHRNADGQQRRGPGKPYGNKPGGRPGGGPRPGGARSGGPGGGNRPYREGGANPNADQRGPRGPRGPGQGQGQGQRAPRPYGHPGNAPSFPSDHANPGSFNPYGDRPRSPRPAGNRPGGNRPPGGPKGPRPGGGNRGPRSGGQGHGGNR